MPTPRPDKSWPCEAYGPEGLEHRALCFIAPELGQRICDAPSICAGVMAAQRRRLYRRLVKLSGGEDENALIAREALKGIRGPNDLLGGPGEPLQL